jgi:hypothetical protein
MNHPSIPIEGIRRGYSQGRGAFSSFFVARPAKQGGNPTDWLAEINKALPLTTDAAVLLG